jgi:hypothetical protein
MVATNGREWLSFQAVSQTLQIVTRIPPEIGEQIVSQAAGRRVGIFSTAPRNQNAADCFTEN